GNVADLKPFAHQFYRPLPARSLNLWDLFRFGLAGCRRDLLALVLLGLAGGLLGLLPPLAIGWIFDRIIPGAERGQLLIVALVLAAGAMSAALFQVTQGVALLRL